MLDPRLRHQTSVADAGRAWAATQAWLDTDPEAGIASIRAEERLRVLRRDVMSRYDRLTTDGVEPVEAMRRVAPFLDRPPARPGEHVHRAAVAASPPGDRQDAPDGVLDTQSNASRQHYIDTGRYLAPDGTGSLRAARRPGAANAGPRRARRAAHRPAGRRGAADRPGRRQPRQAARPEPGSGPPVCPGYAAAGRSPAQRARAGFPVPLTQSLRAPSPTPASPAGSPVGKAPGLTDSGPARRHA